MKKATLFSCKLLSLSVCCFIHGVLNLAKTKLYVRTTCMACRGKGGLHCHYCDIDGKVFVEASYKTVVRYLNDMEKEDLKAEILDKIKEE